MRSAVTPSLMVSVAGMVGFACVLACGTAPIDGPLESDDGVKLPDRTKTPAPDGGSAAKIDTDSGTKAPLVVLTVTLSGTGTGSITSMPSGVTCSGTTCKGSFAHGTMVSLTPAPASGSLFGGWSGGCMGNAACALTMDANVAASADFESLDGAWSGSYTNTRTVNGCTFNNAGKLDVTGTGATTAPAQSATVTGLELRNLQGCTLQGTTTGSAPSAPVTVAGGTLTGTWSFAVAGIGGPLAFPFTAKVTGKTMTGTWTCAGCTGAFTLTKP